MQNLIVPMTASVLSFVMSAASPGAAAWAQPPNDRDPLHAALTYPAAGAVRQTDAGRVAIDEAPPDDEANLLNPASPCRPRWADGFHLPGLKGRPFAMVEFDDDGAGPRPPALYLGGSLALSGSLETCYIARWDNHAGWTGLGDEGGYSVNNWVMALAVFDDDGDGPHPPNLYAGGLFTTAGGATANYIASWDGTSWSPLSGPAGTGVNSYVQSLGVFDDDGPGPHALALYVGGYFTLAGGVEANRIAKWDGAEWSALVGPSGNGVDDYALAIAAFDDDGAGQLPPALYVGGFFRTAGGVSANHVARWDGTAWSSVSGPTGNGTSDDVLALAVFDRDGPGPAREFLYAGGRFWGVGSTYMPGIAQWDGADWSALSGGTVAYDVRALAVFDADGNGPQLPALYAGGDFGNNHIAKWDGNMWSALAGVEGVGVNDLVRTLAVVDDDGPGPNQPLLYVGGEFTSVAGAAINHLARWDGTAWLVADGDGMDSGVSALAVYDDDGPGPNSPALYAGGAFTAAGMALANHIAKWDGTAWSALPGAEWNGTDSGVAALAVFDDDGPGPRLPGLYLAGDFFSAGGIPANKVARWDAEGWTALIGPSGNGPNDWVIALCVFDDDGPGPGLPALYAGGRFTAAGGVSSNKIAKWDGTTWLAVPGIPAYDVSTLINAMITFDDDGPGPNPTALYAGGRFSIIGGIAANYIAKWDGTEWSALIGPNGNGTSSIVSSLAVFDDDGPGPHLPELYAGGVFFGAGGVNAPNVARWNGTRWSGVIGPAGSSPSIIVESLAVFDDDGDGPGLPALYAGGFFTNAGPIIANRIIKWDGTNWSPLSGPHGNGVNDWVATMLGFDDDGAGPKPPGLYVGGYFSAAGGVSSEHIAGWSRPVPPCPPSRTLPGTAQPLDE